MKLNKIIPEKLAYIIYKDDINDKFLLTKFGEVYEYDKNTLRLIAWNKSKYKQLVKTGILTDLDYTDDHLFMGTFKNQDLPTVLNMGIHLKRPHKSGKWIKDKEIKLTHKIKPTYLKGLKFHFVDTIDEVLKIALTKQKVANAVNFS